MATVKQNATVSQKLTVPGGCHYFGEVSFVLSTWRETKFLFISVLV